MQLTFSSSRSSSIVTRLIVVGVLIFDESWLAIDDGGLGVL